MWFAKARNVPAIGIAFMSKAPEAWPFGMLRKTLWVCVDGFRLVNLPCGLNMVRVRCSQEVVAFNAVRELCI